MQSSKLNQIILYLGHCYYSLLVMKMCQLLLYFILLGVWYRLDCDSLDVFLEKPGTLRITALQLTGTPCLNKVDWLAG